MEASAEGGLTYEIEIERSPREMVLPDDPAIEVKPRLYSTTIHTGVNTLAIDASLNGHSLATTSAVLRIKSTAVVVIAADTIAQGQALTDQNTRSRVARHHQDQGSRHASVGQQGWVARRTIQAGVDHHRLRRRTAAGYSHGGAGHADGQMRQRSRFAPAPRQGRTAASETAFE